MSKSSNSKVAAKKARGARGKTVAKVAREKARTTRASHRSKPKVVTEAAHVPLRTAPEKAIEQARYRSQHRCSFEAFRDSQVKGTINAIAERSLAQTREAYERSKHTLQAVLASWERSFGAAGQGAIALNRKVIEVADRNVNNAFDLAANLAAAKNFADVMASHATYWRKQFGNLSARS
ncbi:MAG TPA: phasin family protein [Methyloceanibacter sp.]|nr:phasin family protein [Methyloceanibacter sp.]